MTEGPETATRYLIADHHRLDAWLVRAVARPGAIDLDACGHFRRGLLRHIGLEEKMLLPAAQRRRGGSALPEAARLRRDHGALAALLVPTPTLSIVAAIRTILAAHHPIEEGPGGVYETCERLLGPASYELAAEMRAAPEVPVSAHGDGDLVVAATRRALMRAGYDPTPLGL